MKSHFLFWVYLVGCVFLFSEAGKTNGKTAKIDLKCAIEEADIFLVEHKRSITRKCFRLPSAKPVTGFAKVNSVVFDTQDLKYDIPYDGSVVGKQFSFQKRNDGTWIYGTEVFFDDPDRYIDKYILYVPLKYGVRYAPDLNWKNPGISEMALTARYDDIKVAVLNDRRVIFGSHPIPGAIVLGIPEEGDHLEFRFYVLERTGHGWVEVQVDFEKTDGTDPSNN